MAHEQIIRNGLIVENKFSFLNYPTISVSGITQVGPLLDRNNIVTESLIKSTIESITLSDLSGVTLGTAASDDIIYYNGTEWVATGISYLSDAYSKVESDARFLNLDGSVAMSGNLNMGGNDITNVGDVDGVDVSILKTDYDIFTGTTYVNRTLGDISNVTLSAITANDFIRWNGTAWINVPTTTILGDYFTKTETNANFVSISGDTLVGDLIMGTHNITFTTGLVDGVDVFQLKTDFDNRSLSGNTDVILTTPTDTQLLQFNGSDWVNVDASSVVTNSYTKTESDDKFVFVSGDTMTGELKIEVGGIGNRALTTTGDAYITGNLYVSGVTTSIDVENMAISDNLLLLNSGETGSGVSRGTAGFLVDRGPTTSAVTLMFDESSFTIRVGETPSSLTDNNINIDSTVALATIKDSVDMSDNSFTFYKKHLAPNGQTIGTLINLSGFTTDGNNIILDGSNIIMNGTETVDGVDISVLKTDFDSLETSFTTRSISGNTDVTITTVLDKQLLSYNSSTTQWENVDISDVGGDFYTKSQSDAKFVDASGDTMSGTLILPAITLNGYNITDILDEDTLSSDSTTALATQQSIKAYIDSLSIDDLTDVDTTTIVPSIDDILTWDGSDWVNSGVNSLLSNYYTKSESDTNFVDVDGDTMTGDLNMGTHNITFTTGLVDNVNVSVLKSDYDTFTGTTYVNRTLDEISDVTITSESYQDVLYFSGGSWVNGDLNDLMDNEYVNVDGDTMTGDLTITPLSGTGNRLVYVDSNGKLSESDEYVFKVVNILSANGVIDSFSTTKSKGTTWDYVIDNGTDMRAGTITAVWNGSIIEWNEVTTNDIGTILSSSFYFDLDVSGGLVRLNAVVGAGSWTIDTNRQMIG